MDLYSIGEFSRMSGLPVRTLRFYHERGLLTPTRVEAETGYRSYSRRDLETAQVIRALRGLDFGLDTIAEILTGREDDGDLLEYLERQKHELQREIEHRTDIVAVLETIISQEAEARTDMHNDELVIEEKQLAPVLVGGIRTKGRYRECGKLFGRLGRKLGRHIGGKAMLLCYDDEYREEDADFEPCMPLKRVVRAAGVDVRELPGGRYLSLVHRGPYEGLSRSYARLLEHAKERQWKLGGPSREVYLKGPGMIFNGDPERYLTEIQFPIE